MKRNFRSLPASYYQIKVPVLRADHACYCDDCMRHDELPSRVTHVTRKSPLSLRRATYQLALLFHREMGFDFVQFGVDDQDDYHAFIWTTHDYYEHAAIGACCFRWREWSDAPASFGLQWIWLHPFARRSGLLTEAWPYFRSRFGNFVVEGPISTAMEGFLVKVGER